ncbi:MAG: hypothetical protein Q7W55_01165 [Pseudohongiella sp.]|nr:hypothetical protein [Pseudohongiella sp.]MDO9520488.1 hypothetical protein [Pseudohongiella sp.]MDP2126504.1 hypothetical protein [Pseudohongiella sp.]
MIRKNSFFTATTLLALLMLAGCAQTGGQIGHSVSVCCPGNYAEYREYSIELREIPAFLSDYVVVEFDRAFQEKGLSRNDNRNQLRVTLSYRHVNLNPEQEQIDPFERRIEQDVVLRYEATILVEMRESASGRVVYAGQINHLHSVTPGEFMHEERARPEFANAFRAMLASYPALN